MVLWFWFPLIQFVGLERKRLSRHRLFIVLRVIKFIVKYTLFYKQHFCKQHQAETQKIKQKLSNTLTLNVFYLEIMCFLDSVFYCINSGYWDKNNRAYSKICTQNRCVCLNDRSNHWRCSGKKVFLEISQNSQESNCTRDSFLIKLQAWPATLLKKNLWHRCFPENFVKFLRTPFFTASQIIVFKKIRDSLTNFTFSF